MSIIIRANMPEDCSSCICQKNYSESYSGNIYECRCGATGTKVRHEKGSRPEWCPIISDRMTNSDWKELLAEHWNISKTSAKEMLHGMYQMKAEDNFKKQFG